MVYDEREREKNLNDPIEMFISYHDIEKQPLWYISGMRFFRILQEFLQIWCPHL